MTIEDIDDLPSRRFEGFDWSEHEKVKRLVEYLYGEYTIWYKDNKPGGRLRDSQKAKLHLTHFVLEAYRTHRALPELCMCAHLGNDYYNQDGDRYHPSHLSYRIVKHVTDFLVAADYLEMPLGIGEWHPVEKQRRTTRFRATSRLMQLCQEYKVNPYMIERYGGPEVIIQRAKKSGQSQGDLVDYKDTPFTMRARKNLKKINEYIDRHNLNLDITDDQEEELLQRMLNRDEEGKDKYLDFTKTDLRRIFNNASFKQGGRFYGVWWQQIPGDYRVHITIDGKRTVQLDYSGMHFAIMYAELGMDTPMEDPYDLDGYGGHLRGNIKTAFNIIVNCNNRKQAVETINGRIEKGELSGELGDGEMLLEAFEKKIGRAHV